MVFQKFQKPKKSGRVQAPSDFDDITVKELMQVEAIQLLKKYNNDLRAFVDTGVKYNSRREKVDFSNIHKVLVEMGGLNSRQIKESMGVLKDPYLKPQKNKFHNRQSSLNSSLQRMSVESATGLIKGEDSIPLNPEHVSAPFWSRSFKTVNLNHDIGNPQQNF